MRGAEEIPAPAERIGGEAHDLRALREDQRRVVREVVDERDRQERVAEVERELTDRSVIARDELRSRDRREIRAEVEERRRDEPERFPGNEPAAQICVREDRPRAGEIRDEAAVAPEQVHPPLRRAQSVEYGGRQHRERERQRRDARGPLATERLSA